MPLAHMQGNGHLITDLCSGRAPRILDLTTTARVASQSSSLTKTPSSQGGETSRAPSPSSTHSILTGCFRLHNRHNTRTCFSLVSIGPFATSLRRLHLPFLEIGCVSLSPRTGFEIARKPELHRSACVTLSSSS